MKVVIGQGWAATAAVGFYKVLGQPVTWVKGLRNPLHPIINVLPVGDSAQKWGFLADALGLSKGQLYQQPFLKDFRNKNFRYPQWRRAAQNTDEVMSELLWVPERLFVPQDEVRFDLSLVDLFSQIHQVCMESSEMTSIDNIPVTGIFYHPSKAYPLEVRLASGEPIAAQQVIYADSWSELPALDGIPKPLTFLRYKENYGCLQVCFKHKPLPLECQWSYFSALNKEANQLFDRHVWGYLFNNAHQSVWSVCLTSEEGNNNHEIIKKLKKIKSQLDKMFGSVIDTALFTETILEQQVRFDAEAFFVYSKPLQFIPTIWDSLSFVTDGFGFSSAIIQVSEVLKMEPHSSLLESTSTVGHC